MPSAPQGLQKGNRLLAAWDFRGQNQWKQTLWFVNLPQFRKKNIYIHIYIQIKKLLLMIKSRKFLLNYTPSFSHFEAFYRLKDTCKGFLFIQAFFLEHLFILIFFINFTPRYWSNFGDISLMWSIINCMRIFHKDGRNLCIKYFHFLSSLFFSTGYRGSQ